ncbi:hypothetical protein ACQEV2_00775 [Streptomyces sp. CA-251387]|uniref:hypothetical protein n=1 Tax=Streptomyces sp. CA-251387 TaxID=3240064 RepID=UPI003D903AE4
MTICGAQARITSFLGARLTGRQGQRGQRDWYRELDLLSGGIEKVIGADSTLSETVDRVMLDTGLAGLPALEH